MSSKAANSRSRTPTTTDYWAESRRPLTSLVFISPLLLVYEIGILVLGPHAVRNGVDVWLRGVLEWLDLGQYFLLPALTIGLLLAWHHLSQERWQLRAVKTTLAGMTLECGLLALGLRLLLALQQGLFYPLTPASAEGTHGIGSMIGYLGAGVYEELLFRLILLPPAILGMRRLGASSTVSTVAAVALMSLVFAAAHYVGPYGNPLNGYGFLFRFVAGVFFSVLFVKRGFGIAAGTHAGYDILVGWA